MQEILVLIPHGKTAADKLQGWEVAHDGAVQLVSQSFADIAARRPSKLTLVVPAQALSWHRIGLPPALKLQGDKRLPAILQNLLEDELLTDAASVHIALAPKAQAGSTVLAGVCDGAWLGGWLQQAEAVGLKVFSIKPEVPPDAQEGYTALCTSHGHQSWATLQVGDSWCTLPLTSAVAALQPQGGRCLATAGAALDAQRIWGESDVTHLSEHGFVHRLLASKWDLAQNQYASNPVTRIRRRAVEARNAFVYAPAWRSARWACVALSAVCVIGLNAQWWLQASSLQAKRAAVSETVRQVFPQLTVIIDPIVQMAREMDVLKQRAGLQQPSDFLPMAAAIGQVVQALPSKPQGLEYTDKQMLLTGLSPQDAVELAKQLHTKGYAATVSSDSVRVRWEN